MNIAAVARAVAGVLIAGVISGLAFLIMVQGSFHRGITDFDYAHVLGTAIKGTAEDVRNSGALGVIGDTAGPTALHATLIAGVVILAIHALVMARFVRRGWIVQGLVLAALIFVAIGVVYVPYADAHLDTPIGPWGADGGKMTPVVFAGASILTGLIGSRCYSLVQSAAWWEPKEVAVEETLEEITTGFGEPSLELPEEGREEGGVRP